MTDRVLTTAVPNLTAAAIDITSGRFTQAWTSFFRAFGAGAPPLQAVAVGTSPLVWTAPGPGELVFEGGGGISLQLVRARASVAVPGGVVPVATGDTVTAFFAAAPGVTFIPRTI